MSDGSDRRGRYGRQYPKPLADGTVTREKMRNVVAMEARVTLSSPSNPSRLLVILY